MWRLPIHAPLIQDLLKPRKLRLRRGDEPETASPVERPNMVVAIGIVTVMVKVKVKIIIIIDR